MSLRRTCARIALTAGVVVAGLGMGAPAHAQGGDNVVVAVNTKDGSSIFKLAFRVHRVASDVVDTGNAAVAYASCTDCQTVAVAIQVVLITGDPEVVAPENVAIAINDGCELCETMASAYQIVLSPGTQVRFTPEGQRQLKDIRQRLNELRKSDLELAAIDAELDAIVADLRTVLNTELVVTRPPPPSEASPSAAAESATPTATTTSVTQAPDTTSSTSPATPTQDPSPAASSAAPSAAETATPDVSPSP